MSDIIQVKYSTDVETLKAEHKVLVETLKNTEKVGVDGAKKIGDEFAKTEVKTKSLKAQLRELKAQLASATDPKDVERLAKAAGALTDQLQDAGDAAKVFASESKFEQMGNAIGSIGGKLKNLDFKGAADQSKLLVAVIKGMNFKDVIAGAKDLGTTFINMGKALLGNPLILAAAAITGVVLALKEYSDSLKENTAVIEENNKAIDTIRENTNKLADEYDNAVQRRLKANGLITDSDEKKNASYKKYSDLEERQRKELKEAAIKYSEEIGINEAMTIDSKLRKQDELRKRLKELATAQAKELSLAGRLLNEEIGSINAEAYAVELTKQKAKNEKNKAEYEKHLKELADLTKKLSDLQLKRNNELLALDADRDAKNAKIRKDAEVDYIKAFKDGAKEMEDVDTELSKTVIKNIEDVTKKTAEAEEKRKKIREGAVAAAQSLLGSAQQISANYSQQKIDASNEEKDNEIKNLDEQLATKQISQAKYDMERKKLDEKFRKEQAAIKKNQFETDKQLSIIQTIISTAQAVAKASPVVPLMLLAAAVGAAQVAVIASQPTPKFAKGVVDLKGKGTGTSDEIHAMLSKGETVITAQETQRYKGLLTAMNKGKAHEFIKHEFIAPALREQAKRSRDHSDKTFADNLMRSIMLNSGSFKDENLLESLKMSRKNDKQIAMFMVSQLKSGSRSNHKW